MDTTSQSDAQSIALNITTLADAVQHIVQEVQTTKAAQQVQASATQIQIAQGQTAAHTEKLMLYIAVAALALAVWAHFKSKV